MGNWVNRKKKNSSQEPAVDMMKYVPLGYIDLDWFIDYFWKEGLNSDCQQFHQHQQNEQPQFHLKLLNTTTKIITYCVGSPDPGLRQVKKCGRIKPVNAIPWFVGFYVSVEWRQ